MPSVTATGAAHPPCPAVVAGADDGGAVVATGAGATSSPERLTFMLSPASMDPGL